MIGLALWTFDHQVMWVVLGLVAITLCWARSQATDDDRS
jgi:hypothetical protein